MLLKILLSTREDWNRDRGVPGSQLTGLGRQLGNRKLVWIWEGVDEVETYFERSTETFRI